MIPQKPLMKRTTPLPEQPKLEDLPPILVCSLYHIGLMKFLPLVVVHNVPTAFPESHGERN